MSRIWIENCLHSPKFTIPFEKGKRKIMVDFFLNRSFFVHKNNVWLLFQIKKMEIMKTENKTKTQSDYLCILFGYGEQNRVKY
jgi:hypothetical protein